MYIGWTGMPYAVENDLQPPAHIGTITVYAVLGFEPRASHMLCKHSTNRAACPA